MAPAPRPARPRARTARQAALAAALGVASLVAGPAGSPAAHAEETGSAGSDLTVVQANLLSPQSERRFRSDVRSVMRQAPDLITYNEVAFRSDADLAPEGYELWRGTRDRFTKATPVAWRSDAFTATARGTTTITDWRGRPAGRTIEIGRRQANWVTLEGADGRALSLVSVHVAPRSHGMPDLNRPSVRRIGSLVERLAVHGPVLVGGDFNVPVGGSRYAADLFARAQMRSTFELTGSTFGTSDHGNGRAAIDYVFVRGEDQLQVDSHYPVELRSDHDAVVARLSWTADAPSTTTTIANDPSGAPRERRAVAAAAVGAIRSARPDDLVQVATRGTDLPAVVRVMSRAHARGVRVEMVTRSPQLSTREQRLAAMLRGTGRFERCTATCAREWQAVYPPSMVLVSDAEDRPLTLVEVSRKLRQPVITRRTRATIRTGALALAEARRAFRG